MYFYYLGDKSISVVGPDVKNMSPTWDLNLTWRYLIQLIPVDLTPRYI
jgi:hypothetical protein